MMNFVPKQFSPILRYNSVTIVVIFLTKINS
jgi:hypothetical protein